VEHTAVEDDRTGYERRTTVSEAAEILGISAEAVRGRIRRGTIPVERQGGTVYVLIERLEEYRTTDDQSRTTGDQPGDRTDLLIAELQDRIRSLEEANRENRRIIAALTSRIPAIEAPQEVQESPEPSADMPMGSTPRGASAVAQEPAERVSWWRRMFGS
jgi:hypothetical protein